ncbi:hypothetical protein BsWGS_18384 [Bradybaena similaris]
MQKVCSQHIPCKRCVHNPSPAKSVFTTDPLQKVCSQPIPCKRCVHNPSPAKGVFTTHPMQKVCSQPIPCNKCVHNPSHATGVYTTYDQGQGSPFSVHSPVAAFSLLFYSFLIYFHLW